MNLLNWLADIDPKPENIDRIKEALAPIVHRHKTRLFYYKSSEIFRGRICDNSFHRGLKLKPADLSYNPNPASAPLNRANRPNRPMFYGSDIEIGVYNELNARPGDHVIFCQWKVDKEIKLFNLGYTNYLYDSNRALEAKNPVTDQEKEYLESYDAKRLEFFLTELFTAIPDHNLPKEHIYSISTSVAEKFLEGPFLDPSITPQGIIYPSVKFMTEADKVDNFAILPEAVDSHLSWMKAELVAIEAIINAGEMRVARLDSSTSLDKDGNFIWHDPSTSFTRLQRI